MLLFSRVPGARLAARALEGEVVEIPVRLEPGVELEAQIDVSLRPLPGAPPAEIGIWAEGDLKGRVPASHHNEVDQILTLGFEPACELRSSPSGAMLAIRLPTPD